MTSTKLVVAAIVTALAAHLPSRGGRAHASLSLLDPAFLQQVKGAAFT